MYVVDRLVDCSNCKTYWKWAGRPTKWIFFLVQHQSNVRSTNFNSCACRSTARSTEPLYAVDRISVIELKNSILCFCPLSTPKCFTYHQPLNKVFCVLPQIFIGNQGNWTSNDIFSHRIGTQQLKEKLSAQKVN